VKPVLIVENDQMLAGPGWIRRVMERRGVPYRIVDATSGGLDGIDASQIGGLITLGGRAHAWEEDVLPFLARERQLTEQCLAADVPVLGCCLGGQILARALGGTTQSHPCGEYGWLDVSPVGAEAARDPLFSRAGARDPVYLWHLDEFTLPPGAVHLSSSEATPVQAFRHGRAWGLQFHPECDLELYDIWHRAFPDACGEVGLDASAMRQTAVERERDPALFAVVLLDAFASVLLT
jgi:GMP synthase-like glutamine amidotransferase